MGISEVLRSFFLDSKRLKEDKQREDPIYLSFEKRFEKIKEKRGEFSMFEDENGNRFKDPPSDLILLFLKDKVNKQVFKRSTGYYAVGDYFNFYLDGEIHPFLGKEKEKKVQIGRKIAVIIKKEPNSKNPEFLEVVDLRLQKI